MFIIKFEQYITSQKQTSKLNHHHPEKNTSPVDNNKSSIIILAYYNSIREKDNDRLFERQNKPIENT
jgi:hypothetical protein